MDQTPIVPSPCKPSPLRRHARRSPWLVAGLLLALPAAQADPERAALARLGHELAALAPLISEAERQANPEARIRFRYDWLRQDLARVRLGIQEHIDSPRGEPRQIEPLRGDYRR